MKSPIKFIRQIDLSKIENGCHRDIDLKKYYLIKDGRDVFPGGELGIGQFIEWHDGFRFVSFMSEDIYSIPLSKCEEVWEIKGKNMKKFRK